MQIQIGGWITYKMLIVFWVVPTIEGPLPFTEFAVHVLRDVKSFVLCQNKHFWFDELLVVRGRLPHESFDDLLMVLT